MYVSVCIFDFWAMPSSVQGLWYSDSLLWNIPGVAQGTICGSEHLNWTWPHATQALYALNYLFPGPQSTNKKQTTSLLSFQP